MVRAGVMPEWKAESLIFTAWRCRTGFYRTARRLLLWRPSITRSAVYSVSGGAESFLEKSWTIKLSGFADFRGNMQQISVGNLQENKKAALFLMDYPNQTRLKIFANVEVIDAKDAPEIIEKLTVPGYKAKIERAMILHVEAFDWNCPQTHHATLYD